MILFDFEWETVCKTQKEYESVIGREKSGRYIKYEMFYDSEKTVPFIFLCVVEKMWIVCVSHEKFTYFSV